MESIFKLGILLSVVDRVSGPSSRIGESMTGLRGKVLSLGPAFDKFKSYGLILTTIAAGVLNMFAGAAMATEPTQKALGELSSVGIVNLRALEAAGTDFSNKWSGTTKAEFIGAAYDIKSGISSLTDEGVAEFTKLAALTGKATKSTTAEMTSLFATGYGIYKEMFGNLTDMQFGEVFSAGISASVKNFKTTGSGMAQSISQLGATATTAKVPLEEQLTILGMLQATMSGSEAGTKYKAVMQSAAGAGEKLKLQFLDANNQLLSMPEILLALQSKYGSTLDAMEKMEIQKAFGTQEAVAVIDLLYGKIGDLKGNITELSGAMSEGRSYSEQMAAAMNIDIGAGGNILAQQWHNLVEVVGRQLIPVMVPLFAWIGNILIAMQDFAKEHETVVQTAVIFASSLAGVVFVLGGLAAVLGSVGLLWPNVAKGFGLISNAAVAVRSGLVSAVAATKAWILWQRQAFLTALYFHGGVMGLARAMVVSFVGAVKAAIAAVWSFTASLLANPITWVVLAVVGLGTAIYWLYQRFEGVRSVIDKVMYGLGFFVGWMRLTGRAILEALAHPIDFIRYGFENASQSVELLVSGIRSVIGRIKAMAPDFMASGKALWSAFTDGLTSMVSRPVDIVKSGLSKLRDLLPFSDAKEGPLSTLTLSGVRLMETLGSGIESAGPGLVKTFGSALAGIMAFAGSVFSPGAPADPVRVTEVVQPKVVSSEFQPWEKIINRTTVSEQLTAAGRSDRQPEKTVEKKEIRITINGLTMPGVSDADSFIRRLQDLAEGYDA